MGWARLLPPWGGERCELRAGPPWLLLRDPQAAKGAELSAPEEPPQCFVVTSLPPSLPGRFSPKEFPGSSLAEGGNLTERPAEMTGRGRTGLFSRPFSAGWAVLGRQSHKRHLCLLEHFSHCLLEHFSQSRSPFCKVQLTKRGPMLVAPSSAEWPRPVLECLLP